MHEVRLISNLLFNSSKKIKNVNKKNLKNKQNHSRLKLHSKYIQTKSISWIGIAGTTNANASFSAHHNQFIFFIQVWTEKRSHSALFHPVPVPPGDEAGQKSRSFQFLSSLFPRQHHKTTHSSSSGILGKLFCSLREMLNYFKRQLRQFWGAHWEEAGIEREKESGLKTGKKWKYVNGSQEVSWSRGWCVSVCVCMGDLMWWPDLRGACFWQKGLEMRWRVQWQFSSCNYFQVRSLSLRGHRWGRLEREGGKG